MRQGGATAALVVCALIAACAAPTDPGREDSRSVALTASPINAGETGRAMLVPLGDRTQVNITISGVPGDLTTRPVHLYTFIHAGSCANPAPQPAYSLNDRVLAQSPTSTAMAAGRGPLTITNVAPVSLDALYKEAHAIRVTTSPADGSQAIFCGDIR